MTVDALGTDSVAELRLGVLANVQLDLLPCALIVFNFFAIGADFNQAAENLNLMHRSLQVQVPREQLFFPRLPRIRLSLQRES